MTFQMTDASLAPFVEEEVRTLLEEARKATQHPIPVPEIPIAGFSPLQLQAMERAQQTVGGFQPYIEQAAGLVPAQQEVVQRALSGLGGAQAGIQGLLESGQFRFDPSRGVQAFYNPYEQQVTQQIQQEIGRQRQEALGDVSAQLAGQGGAEAFGGSGAERARERVERRYADVLNQQLSNLRYQGYQNALTQAQQEFGQQFERQQGLQSLLGDIAIRYPQLGEAIRGVGQEAVRLGGLQQEAALQDVGLLSSFGGQQQAQLQSEMEAQRAQEVARLQDPFARIGFVRDILTGVPRAGDSTIRQTTAPTPEPFGLAQLAGLGSAALQFYNPFTRQYGAAGNAMGFGPTARQNPS
jgi:hypothetical protein